jgi:hypothetical protein
MELKSAFNYYAAFDRTAKIDFTLSLRARGKVDSEQLLRLQRYEKLDCAYSGNLTIVVPLGQRCYDFIKDHHARNNRRVGEMPG